MEAFSNLDGIGQIALHPNGKEIFSCGPDGEIRQFAAETLKDENVITHHEQAVNCIAFSPKGDCFVTGSDDHAVCLFLYPDCKFQTNITRLDSAVHDLAWDPEGASIAISGDNNLIKIVDIMNTTRVNTLKGHTHPVKSLAFDPKGEFLAAADCGGRLRIWRTDDLQCYTNMKLFPETDISSTLQMMKMDWSPDGKFLALPGNTHVTLLSRDDNIPTILSSADMTAAGKDISLVKYSPNGRYLVTATEESLMVWNMSDQTVCRELSLSSECTSVVWSLDSNELIYLSADGYLRKWEHPVPLKLIPPYQEIEMDQSEKIDTDNNQSLNKNDNNNKNSNSDEDKMNVVSDSSNVDNPKKSKPKDASGLDFADAEDDDDDNNNNNDDSKSKSKSPNFADTEAGASSNDVDGDVVDDDDDDDTKRRRLRKKSQKEKEMTPEEIAAEVKKALELADRYDGMLEDPYAEEREREQYDSKNNNSLNLINNNNNNNNNQNGMMMMMMGNNNLQPAFMPGCTPIRRQRRYLSWNAIGSITSRDEDTFHSIEIIFSDSSSRRPVRLTDHYTFTMASLGQHGAIFASPTHGALGDSDFRPSTAFYKTFDSWAQQSDWTIQMERDENILCVAGGNAWVALGTSRQFVRILSFSGGQRCVFSLPGPVVTMIGDDDRLAVVFHQGIGLPGCQNLGLLIIDVEKRVTTWSGQCIISPNSTLSWIGFNQVGMLLTFDTAGILRGLSTAWANQQVPLLDTKAHARANERSVYEVYWPVALIESQLMTCICVGGSKFPSAAKRPILSAIPIKMPLFGLERQDVQLEEQHARQHMFQKEAWINKMQTPSAKQVAQLDKQILKLVDAACSADKDARALDLCTLLQLPKSVTLAIKLATRHRKQALVERIQLVLQSKFTHDGPADYSVEAHPSFSSGNLMGHGRGHSRTSGPSSSSSSSSSSTENDPFTTPARSGGGDFFARAKQAAKEKKLAKQRKLDEVKYARQQEEEEEQVSDESEAEANFDDNPMSDLSELSEISDSEADLTKKTNRQNKKKKKTKRKSNNNNNDDDQSATKTNTHGAKRRKIEKMSPAKKKKKLNPFAKKMHNASPSKNPLFAL